MEKFFSLDSPVMVFLNKMADLMILNIIVIIACLPLITIGPALTAMNYILLKMVRKEEGYLIRPFLKSFKENFKQATISWMFMVLLIIIFYADFVILNNINWDYANYLRIALIAIGVIAILMGIYVFPLIARFENTIRGTFKNALFMSLLNLPKTLLMVIIYFSPVVLLYFITGLLPVIFLLGITGPGYICAMLYSKIFKRFEPEETDTDNWTLSLDEIDLPENEPE
jgi:uncharacterized membrane protein YesL